MAEKKNILIESGADFVFEYPWKDENGEPVDLTGATLEAQLREFESDTEYYIFTCAHNGEGGVITLSMPHEITAVIPFTTGYYDVFATYPGVARKKVLFGNVTISPNIVRALDGTLLYLLEVDTYDDLPETGDYSRLYLVCDTRHLYRWNGENYISALETMSLHNEGAWDIDTAYDKFATVTHSGSSYMALHPVPSGTAISNTYYWLKLAEAGGAENIDDNAGAGDTTVTWSADKLKMLTDQLRTDVDILSDSAPVNVLTLGFDNTGSTDISALFTQYSALYSLYFPAGKYRIDNPVEVKHSVIGAGYVRKYSDNQVPDVTWFISNVESGNLLHVTATTAIQLNKFNIKAYGEENCIDIEIGNYYDTFFVNEIGIYNAGGTGLMVEEPGTSYSVSRIIYIDNLTVWGNVEDNSKKAVGVWIDGKTADCRLTNLEIMYTHVGIRNVSKLTFGSNWHIWPGRSANVGTAAERGEWWKSSVGIDLPYGGILTLCNVYLDTCYYGITLRNGSGTASALINIYNLIYLDNDSSIGDLPSGVDKGEFFHIISGTHKCYINGGYFYIHPEDISRIKYLYNYSVKCKDIVFYNGQQLSSSTKHTFFVGLPCYNHVAYRTRCTTNANLYTYSVLAKVFGFEQNGECKFNIITEGSDVLNFEFFVKRTQGTFTVKTNYSNYGWYYKVDGDMLYIYKRYPNVGPWTLGFQVYSDYQCQIFMYDYYTMTADSPESIDTQITAPDSTVPTGLTAIPVAS